MLPDNRRPLPVLTWLSLLVGYCQPPDMSASLESIALLEPALSSAHPIWVFCEASARSVEAFDRRRAVPSLSEIERPLTGWIERTSAPSREEQRQMALAVQPQRRIGA